MRRGLLCVLALSFASCLAIGCGAASAPAPSTPTAPAANAGSGEEAKFAKAIAELSEEDRPLATAQKFCAVEHKSRLGSMGVPFKVMIDDQPVFLCCEGCKAEALKDPQATLAKVEQLKQAAQPEAAQ
jgi:hypothetical protein